ncbi:non-heme ferritin-like protein [Mangrovibacter yixingensis]|uniref:non-heme ferritin-like protein n=1 Tax=Mangrovibacter yixingensis TaxID=1529639 RepID=UPI001CFB8363|nr:non-heme ferritin-like protein [Mangrovibacter yixingensis]
MVVIDIVSKLNVQMNREFYSSNLYLQLSAWCVEHNLHDTAHFLRTQAQGTVTLMMRFFDHLKKMGENPVVQPIEGGLTTGCSSLPLLFEKMLSDYHFRAESLNQLQDEATSINDLSTLLFLQQIEEVQRKDEALLMKMLEMVREADASGMCLRQTDHILAKAVMA